MGSIAWNPPPIARETDSISRRNVIDDGDAFSATKKKRQALIPPSHLTGSFPLPSRPNQQTKKVYLAYDGRMTLHKPVPGDDQEIMEQPDRVRLIYERLQSMPQASFRFLEIPCIPASREAITLVHTPEHYDRLWDTAYMSDDELLELTVPDDLYFGRDTFFAARMAVGGVLECVKAVTAPNPSHHKAAIAVVRPPGHHALENQGMGKSKRWIRVGTRSEGYA